MSPPPLPAVCPFPQESPGSGRWSDPRSQGWSSDQERVVHCDSRWTGQCTYSADGSVSGGRADVTREGKQLGRGEARKFGCHKIWNLCVWPGAGPCLFPGLSFFFCTSVRSDSWSLCLLECVHHSRQRVNAAQRPEQFLGLSGQPLLCTHSALSPHSDPKFPRSFQNYLLPRADHKPAKSCSGKN